MYSKHLISVTALLLSTAACSSDATNPGNSAGAGPVGTAGSSPVGTAGSPNGAGGSGPITGTAGSPVVGTAGSAPTAGGPNTGTAGAPNTGTGGAGGSGSTGTAGAGNPGGAAGAAGTPSSASFKCDNLTLAPSTTGVAQPAGAAGGLKVLDWAGFKGAVSFTFDDNTPSQMPNYAALKATGAHFTFFVVGNWLSTSTSLIPQYKATLADGQEIASHTYSHDDSDSLADLQKNQTYISTNFGVNANSMAAPNCKDGWGPVAPSVLFQDRGPCSNSTTGGLLTPTDGTSPFALPAMVPDEAASSATLSSAIVAGKWRIFVIHGFDSQNGTYHPVPIANVTATMSKSVSDGFWAETMTNVGAYWQGGKLIPSSATSSATWTLPAKFPPNMCVRITTTGGTVTQKGETIKWDPHGYYQISLNAGEVTIK